MTLGGPSIDLKHHWEPKTPCYPLVEKEGLMDLVPVEKEEG